MAKLAEKLPDVFGREQASRKPLDYYKKTDPAKAEEQLQKSKDFAIKMILAEAKNVDPFAEDSGSNKSSQMLETANLIAQLDSIGAQVGKMDEMVEAVKNPGYNAFDLQGREVSYDNGKRFFDGSSPVTFEYNLKSSGENKNFAISTTIKIKDKDGTLVQEVKGASCLGNHKFLWDGSDKKGNKLPEGSYSIEVSSNGSGTINGKVIPFIVQATTLASAIVSSVEVQNGVVRKLILDNGVTIDKDQVVSIKKEKETDSSAKLASDLIGKKLELDLGRIRVSNGNVDIYFNNHVQNPGEALIDVYDEHNKFVKSLETEKIKTSGIGKISFEKTEIENGNYTVKIKVKDLDNNNRLESLNPLLTTVAVGVNYTNETVVTTDGHEFNAYTINKVLTGYVSDIDRRAAEYQGSNVEYNDSVFIFEPGTFNPEVISKAPEEDGAIISHELLRIYTQDRELVATLKADYNPFDQLDEASKATLLTHQEIIAEGAQYQDLLENQKLVVNRYIEENIKNGTYRFKDNYATILAAGGRWLKFPLWNGAFDEVAPENLRGGNASAGQTFSIEHSTIYIKLDGNLSNSESVIDRNIGFVESVDKDGGELFLNLRNGKRIPEARVIGRV